MKQYLHYMLVFLLIPTFFFESWGQYTFGVTNENLAEDSANNYNHPDWEDNSNEGEGFEPWIFDTSNPNGGSSGRFIGNFSPEIDTNGNCFVLYANFAIGATSGATRVFPKVMQRTDQFSIKVGVNFRDGAKGFDLGNSDNTTIINFNVAGDEYNLAGTTLFDDIYNENTVFEFTFTQNENSVDWSVVRSGGLSDSQSGTIAGINSNTITNIRLYNVSADTNNDGGSGERNLFFNDLKFISKYTIPNGENKSLSTSETSAPAPYIWVKSGAELDLGGNTLNIENNGLINNLGILNDTNGTLNFLGNGSILGTLSLNDVILNDGGVSFGTTCTINGSLTLNSGSFVDTDSPIYAPGSSLIYKAGSNVTAPYQRRSEWSNADPQGTPYNVIIQEDTAVNLGFERRNFDAIMKGDLTIEEGSSLFMDFNNDDMQAPLIVEGNFVNNGTISLSNEIEGDLKVFGDFTNNGTFDFNNRALFMEGSEVQQLIAADNFEIPFLVINKSGGEVVLNQNIVINGDEGIALNLSNQGILNLNGHQLQIGDNTITYVEFFDNAALKGSTDSKILFKSTNSDSGSLKFKNEGFGNYLSEFEMDGNGAISLSDTLNILRRFVLKNGTFNSNENLTFKSSDSLTAIIPEVVSSSITGDICVERHYPMGNRAFRYVSSPVTSAASIHAQWQEGINNFDTNNNQNLNPGFGTHITGSQTGANGFDATQTGNPSLFTWNNLVTNPAWAPIPNTNGTTLEAGKAYALMMRGDRSTNLNSNSATGNSTVLRSWGEPIIGEHTVSTSINDTLFALIGNPYQAQVDLTEVEKPGFGNFFYIWDPTIGERGGYATVQIDGTTITVTTTPSETTQANQFLQVGQAFFIQATADNPSMTFQESHKSDATDNLATFSIPNYANINVNLYRNGNQMVDGLRISLAEDFDDEVNFEDAVKLWNEQEYIAIDKNQSWLMVEKRSIPENDTIRLFTGNYVASDYQLKIDVQQLENHEVYLNDAYLNESQLLNNNQQHTYSFSVDASLPESVHPSRFSLFFYPMPLSTDIALQNNRIACYPNPVTEGTLNVLWPLSANSDNTTLIEVYDVLGRVVFNQKTNANSDTVSINISTLSSGIYVLKATRKEQHFTTKISVERN